MYNYYNYFNNVNFQKQNLRNMDYQNDNLFNPYQGLVRGNIFKNLYQPYKNEKIYEIKPMNEQAKILTDIDALEFAMIDLNLYLDVNPDDQKAIEIYNMYRIENEELLKFYQERFGPLLLNSDVLNNMPWMWDNKPWPWEN